MASKSESLIRAAAFSRTAHITEDYIATEPDPAVCNHLRYYAETVGFQYPSLRQSSTDVRSPLNPI